MTRHYYYSRIYGYKAYVSAVNENRKFRFAKKRFKIQFMIMETKRFKLNEQSNDDRLADPKCEMELMNLNDDCLLEIFQRLPLIDLCRMSEVCNRLKKLTSNCFKRKYPKLVFDEMGIERNTDGNKIGEIVLQPRSKHVKYFSQVMANVKICFPSERDVDMVRYIRDKCQNLKRIIFDGGSLLQSYGDDLKDVLKSVETIVFMQSVSQASYFDEILKHCPRIKHLILHETHGGNKMNEILLGKYSTLQHLKHIHEGTINVDNLNVFFQQNPNVTMVTLYFCDLLDGSNESALDLIRSVVTNGIHLVQLFLSFYGYYNWTRITSDIEALSERECFKHLELQFAGFEAERMMEEHGSQIATFKCLHALHFKEFNNLELTLSTIGRLSALKKLHLHDVHFEDVTPSLVKALPNLQQLHIIGLVDYVDYYHVLDYAYSYNDLIELFVCHSAKLTNIYIFGYVDGFCLDVDLLNEKRKNLKNAEKLTVHKDEFLGDDEIELSFIKIKNFELRHDEYNINNPLSTYFTN